MALKLQYACGVRQIRYYGRLLVSHWTAVSLVLCLCDPSIHLLWSLFIPCHLTYSFPAIIITTATAKT